MIEADWHPYRPDPSDRWPAGGHSDFSLCLADIGKILFYHDSIVLYARKFWSKLEHFGDFGLVLAMWYLLVTGGKQVATCGAKRVGIGLVLVPPPYPDGGLKLIFQVIDIFDENEFTK